MNRARHVAAGFTLLEVAVALAILGVGIVTVLRIFSGSLHLQDRASRQTRVVLHARVAMDALLFQPDILEKPPPPVPITAEGFQTQRIARRAGPEEGFAKSDLGQHSDLVLVYLEVDVTWQDGAGSKSYVLKSLRWAPDSE